MTRKFGKTIQIFLPDGNPRGLRVAEITSRTVTAIQIPRPLLDDASSRPELGNVGIYFLFGTDEGKPKVYIGEAENCLNRLKQHNKQKEFWSQAIVFTSKTLHFTKTHIKFLEWLCCATATRVNRFVLENGNSPSKPHVQESIEADLYENFDSIQLLTSTLGYAVFDEIRKPDSAHLVECKGRGVIAQGEYTEDGLTVFKGSQSNLEEAQSVSKWPIRSRAELVDSGVLKVDGSFLVFTEDYVFSSPSAAASVVLARQANGWTEWKYKNGKTLDEVIRQNQE